MHDIYLWKSRFIKKTFIGLIEQKSIYIHVSWYVLVMVYLIIVQSTKNVSSSSLLKSIIIAV